MRGRRSVGSDAAALYQHGSGAWRARATAGAGRRRQADSRCQSLRYETATLVERRASLSGELAAVGAPDQRRVSPSMRWRHRRQHRRAAWRRLSPSCPETLATPCRLPGASSRRRATGASTVALTRRRRRLRVPGAPRAHRHQSKASPTPMAVSADASAQQLLAWNRGHWAIESKNHQPSDKTLDEDACLARSGLAPANRATCNNLDGRWHNAAAALRYFTLHRKAALQTLLPRLSALPAPLSALAPSFRGIPAAARLCHAAIRPLGGSAAAIRRSPLSPSASHQSPVSIHRAAPADVRPCRLRRAWDSPGCRPVRVPMMACLSTTTRSRRRTRRCARNLA